MAHVGGLMRVAENRHLTWLKDALEKQYVPKARVTGPEATEDG